MDNYSISDQHNTPYQVFTLTNSNGFSIAVCEFGASLLQVCYPDGTDVVLGPKHNIDKEHTTYFGSICGRVAGRISNASFTLNDTIVNLDKNLDNHHLHGGVQGFSHQPWEGSIITQQDNTAIQMKYTSPDGECGYPAEAQATITYTLNDANELIQHSLLIPNAPTIANLTNHVYWNLQGIPTDPLSTDKLLERTPSVLNHYLQVNAHAYYETEPSHTLPTGNILPVKDTALDFTVPTQIGAHIDHDICAIYNGYDHVFAVDNPSSTNISNDQLQFIAKLTDTDRSMEVWSTCPAVVCYTANFLSTPHTAICLETQFPADCPNQDNFPSIMVTPQHYWNQTTVWRFA